MLNGTIPSTASTAAMPTTASAQSDTKKPADTKHAIPSFLDIPKLLAKDFKPQTPDDHAKLCLAQYHQACTEFKTDPARRDKIFAAVDQKNLALVLQHFPHALEQKICVELLRMLVDDAFWAREFTFATKTTHAASWKQLITKIKAEDKELWHEICKQALLEVSCMRLLFEQDFIVANEQSVLRDIISMRDQTVAYLYRGNYLQGCGEYTKAIADYDVVFSLPHQGASAALAGRERGACFMVLGQYGRAIEDYQQAITSLTLFADSITTCAETLYGTYHALGYVFCLTGAYQKAEDAFNKMLKLQPQNTLALLARGLNFERAKAQDKAIADYQAVVRSAKSTERNKLWGALRLHQMAQTIKTTATSSIADAAPAKVTSIADAKKVALTNDADLATLCQSFKPSKNVNDLILLCLAEYSVAVAQQKVVMATGLDGIKAVLKHPDFPHKVDTLLIADWFNYLLNINKKIFCILKTPKTLNPNWWLEVFTILKNHHPALWQHFMIVSVGIPISNYFSNIFKAGFLGEKEKYGLLATIIDDNDTAAAASIRFNTASSCMIQNNYPDAIALFTAYLTLPNPANKIAAHYKRGICYAEMQQYASAVADFTACLACPKIDDLSRAFALFQRADAYANMGVQANVKSDIEAFFTIYPTLNPADEQDKFKLRYYAMQADVLLGRYDFAAQYYESHGDVWLKQPHRDRILMTATNTYFHVGEYKEVERLAGEVIVKCGTESRSNELAAYLQFAKLWYQKGNDEATQRCAAGALAYAQFVDQYHNSYFANAYLISGLSYLRQQKLAQAREAFTKVFKYSDADINQKIWARVHLARLELKLGDAAPKMAGSSAASALAAATQTITTTSSSGVHAVHDPRIHGSPLSALAYKTSAAPRGDDVNSANRYDIKDVKSNDVVKRKKTIPDLAELCSTSTKRDINGAALQCIATYFLTQSSDTLKQLDHTDFAIEINRILSTYPPQIMEPALRGEWVELLLQSEVRPQKLAIENPQELAQQWILILKSIRQSHPRVWLNACIQACLPETPLGQIFAEGWRYTSVICSKRSALAEVLHDLTLNTNGTDLENLDTMLDESTKAALAQTGLKDADRSVLLNRIPGLKGKLKEPLQSFEIADPETNDHSDNITSPIPSSW